MSVGGNRSNDLPATDPLIPAAKKGNGTRGRPDGTFPIQETRCISGRGYYVPYMEFAIRKRAGRITSDLFLNPKIAGIESNGQFPQPGPAIVWATTDGELARYSGQGRSCVQEGLAYSFNLSLLNLVQR